MNAVAFDTLQFARSLREKAHLTPEQAEGMPDAMSEVFASGIPTKGDIVDVRHDIEALRIVTKADIEALRAATKIDIEAFRVETKADFVVIRHDIDALRTSTKSDIEALRLSTRADIATAKSDIIKSMFGMIGFQTVAILGAFVALVRSLH
ncbi:DUF1640 domain-containing protein [Methylobacterium sp. WL103]|nr:DUF1640 domain-containing protein [Methylobacterium sp. WL12]TXM97682.1 DUF1640 domain-containing protein [Methylobacterium sp. WL103]